MRTQDMTPEQIEKAKALQTPEEMFAYARDNGIDLTDEEMDAIAGGSFGIWSSEQKKTGKRTRPIRTNPIRTNPIPSQSERTKTI